MVAREHATIGWNVVDQQVSFLPLGSEFAWKVTNEWWRCASVSEALLADGVRAE